MRNAPWKQNKERKQKLPYWIKKFFVVIS